jgi:hypothetical protein
MFASWGPCPAGNCPVCATDLDGNCTTGAGDLEIVLDCWGPCLWPGSVPPPQGIQNCLDQYGQSPIRLATCLELVLGGS